MKRRSIPHLVFAATLALLLPLEQLHCACMVPQTHPAPASSHPCCESASRRAAAHHSQHHREPHTCTCAHLLAVTLPTGIEVGAEMSTAAPIAVLSVPAVGAPVSIVTETVPALDVECPPPLDDPGAHGLRAPPVFA